MEKREKLTALFRKFLRDEVNREELQDLFDHFQLDNDRDTLGALIREQLTDDASFDKNDLTHFGGITDKVEQQLKSRILGERGRSRKNVIRRLAIRLSAAAVLLLGLSAGLYFLYPHITSEKKVSKKQINDLAPGGNRATLTLANGNTINLDDAAIGQLAEQRGSDIVKTEDGLISYENRGNTTASGAVAYNTIITPNGGQYRVILPDGSKVWLNAASSLRYPTYFSGKERVVELTGEGYFEVAHRSGQPFRVRSKGQSVEVLGTQFNINAYDNEPTVNTTLVTGSVRIRQEHSGKTEILDPGQQAVLSSTSLKVRDVDAAEYTGWKEGLFLFYNIDLHVVIRQIERWYDVSFDFSGAPEHMKLYGELPRNVNLSAILEVLERSTGKKFILEERRVIVSE